jgi:hypothetical protein
MKINPEQQREIDALRQALQFTRKLNARLVKQNSALRRRLNITKPTPRSWYADWEQAKEARA